MNEIDNAVRGCLLNKTMWLSLLVSTAQNIVLASDSNQKSVEDSSVKFSSVKAVAKLAEIHLQMLGAGAVIGTVDESLCVSNHVVQPFEQLAIGIEHFPFMVIAFSQRLPVCIKAIGLDSGTVSDAAPCKTLNRSALDIGCELHPQISGVSLLVFRNSYKDRLIVSGASAFAGNVSLAACAKVGIVKLHDSLQNVTLIPHFHGGSDPAKEIPGSLIADLKLTCQGKGGDTALVTGHQVDRPEPLGQRQVAAVHDGIGGQRGLMTAVGALVAAIAIQSIAMPMATYRAHKTLGPFDCIQVFHASFFIGKPLDKLAETQSFLFRHIWHLPLMPLYMSCYPINVTFYYILCFA